MTVFAVFLLELFDVIIYTCRLICKAVFTNRHYGGLIGPLATINRKPGQAWKGAAVAVALGAEMWLVRLPPLTILISIIN